MDITSIEELLESGKKLKIKYRYPLETGGLYKKSHYGVRCDRLSDVSIELNRFYTLFRGENPIWLEADEVIDVVPDDGVYEEFPNEYGPT